MRDEKEYETLRDEILAWQERRFAVLGGTVVIISALVGWIINNPSRWSWMIASSLPMLILFSACYLSWMFARFTVMIGAYCEIFHKSLWEKRNRLFERDEKFLRFNTALSIMYVGLGAASVTIFYISCTKPVTLLELLFFILACTAFLFMSTNLAFGSYPRNSYLARWNEIQAQEKKASEIEADRSNQKVSESAPQPAVLSES